MRKRKYFLLLLFCFIVSCLILTGCGPQTQDKAVEKKSAADKQLDDILSEEISYGSYSGNGFSVLYPLWPAAEQGDGSVEVSVTKGYCSVAINEEGLPAEQWFGMFEDSIAQQKGEILESDEEGNRIKFSLQYQNITLLSDNQIFECNDKSTAVTITCIEQVDDKMQELHDMVFGSASCEKKEVEYEDFQDQDFLIEYPDWSVIPEETGQRVLGVSKGVCSVIVDKHNALPKDIFDWIEKSLEVKGDQELQESSHEGDVYSLVYGLEYDGTDLTAYTKVLYCNYQSYIAQVVCMDEFFTDDLANIKDQVLDSVRCSRYYEIPTPEKIKQEKEEVVEKEPDVIEEIEDEIVKTDAGAEFGIDEELIVYFINNNAFFNKVMKDFPKGNLVIEDKENDRELRLRVTIDGAGKIILLEDGEHDDEDVTLIIPLRDALNIFSNAQNINPLTLIGFAINVRTEPAEIKNQVLQKVLRGEYN